MSDELRILRVQGAGEARLAGEDARREGAAWNVTHATHIDDALRLHGAGDAYDLILLDIDPSACTDPSAVQRLATAAPHTPIVVRASRAHAGLAEQAVAAGADDCVVEEDLAPGQLGRVLRTAVARRRRGAARAGTAPNGLDEVFRTEWSGEAALATALPTVFDDLVADMSALVELALRSRESGQHSALLAYVKTFAARLAMLTAQPRDVGEIHAAVAAKRRVRDPAAPAVTWVLVVVLAELCALYRNEALDKTGPRVAAVRTT